MKKRIYTIEANTNELKIAWGRDYSYNDPAIIFAYGGDNAKRSHIYSFMETFEGRFLSPNFTTFLKNAGYDLTTLKMSVRHSAAAPKKTYSKKRDLNEVRITCVQNADQSYVANYLSEENEEFNEFLQYYFDELDANNISYNYLVSYNMAFREKDESQTLLESLKNEGYDLNTFKFSIKKSDN